MYFESLLSNSVDPDQTADFFILGSLICVHSVAQVKINLYVARGNIAADDIITQHFLLSHLKILKVNCFFFILVTLGWCFLPVVLLQEQWQWFTVPGQSYKPHLLVSPGWPNLSLILKLWKRYVLHFPVFKKQLTLFIMTLFVPSYL